MNSTGQAILATKVPERSGTKVLCGRTYSISTRLFFFRQTVSESCSLIGQRPMSLCCKEAGPGILHHGPS